MTLGRLHGGDGRVIHVVRDDLLPGGTKERGLLPVLDELADRGTRTFVYASPFCGFAQIALANAVRRVGGEAMIFASVDPSGRLHGYSREAIERGARVIECESLAAAEREAHAFTRGHPGAAKLPLGFACEAFFDAYESALRDAWRRIESMLGMTPAQVFLPVGSGTLLRAFARVLPLAIRIEAVDVNVLSPDDERIAAIERMPRVRLHRSALPFGEAALVSPPFPSNPFYDAKILPFLEALATSSSLWWNVAR